MQEENPNIFSAIKKGVKTSEFWLIFAALALTAWFIHRGAQSHQVAFLDLAAATYAACRTWLKSKAVRAVETACIEDLIQRVVMSAVPNTNIPDTVTNALTGAADNAITNALDFWIYREGGVTATISRVVTGYAHKYPLIPLLVGILMGHLFFSEGNQP